MGTPLISVVIPAYNHEKFVGAAIESVLNQSVDDLELIVVDDGSTDSTADIVQGYTDSRLSYTWQENQDAYNTINRGMGMARGEYVAILNSDDIYSLDRLEVLLEYARENESDCIFTDVVPVSDNGEEFRDPDFGWNQWHRRNRDYYFECGDLYTGFLHGNFMVTTSNLFLTAEAVRTVGNFAPIRYLHDYDFIFRTMLAYPDTVHYLDDLKLLYYRIHSGNTLSEAAIRGREQDLEVIEMYMLARVPEELTGIVQTGTRRLRTLENEIHQVRMDLEKLRDGSTAEVGLMRRVREKLRRMVR